MGDLGGPERTSEVRLLGGRAKRLQVGPVREGSHSAGDQERRTAAKRDMGVNVGAHQPGHRKADVFAIDPLERWMWP